MRRVQGSVLVFTALLFVHPYAHSESRKTCRKVIADSKASAEDPWVHDQVEIVYLPDSLNTKIKVGDKVYSTFELTSGIRAKSDEALRELGEKDAFNTQVRFGISVKKSELAALEEFFADEGGPVLQITCTHVACSGFQEKTGMKIPLPFRVSPTINALYLAANAYMPGTRVHSIEVISKDSEVFKSWRAALAKAKPGLIIEGGLVLVVMAGAGAGAAYFVPIILDDEEKDKEEKN